MKTNGDDSHSLPTSSHVDTVPAVPAGEVPRGAAPGGEAPGAVDELLSGNGYTILQAVLDNDQASRIRSTVISRLDEGAPAGEGALRLGDIINWGSEFENLVTHPRLLAVAHALLGNDATLGACSARVLLPGCEPGALHVDWPYWAQEPGMPVSPPLMMQVIWMMEPFTQHNGGTWVAPTSQTWSGPPEIQRFERHAVQATGEAGDAVVSHGLLWHRTARNLSTEPRVAILINYTQLTVRPMVPMGPFSDEFKARATPALTTLLGFDYASSLRKRAPSTR